MSLPFNRGFLDNAVLTGAENKPMAASNFGAETGSYFLKSTPTTTTPFKEYQLEADPHLSQTPQPHQQQPEPQPQHYKRRSRKHKKRIGCQVSKEQKEERKEPENTCSTLCWSTLPTCLGSTVVGIFNDSLDQNEGFTTIMTKNNRLMYIGVLMFLLFIVYRIFRQC